MLLNTFINLLVRALTNSTSTLKLIDGTELAYSTKTSLGNTSSERTVITYVGGNSCSSSNTSSGAAFNSYSLTFGGGTTEPLVTDYQMETPYNTTDHFSFDAISAVYSDEACTKTLIGTITNISGENLTVSEVGVVASSQSNYNTSLIARSVITPVTLAANETRTFQYTLDFSTLTDTTS